MAVTTLLVNKGSLISQNLGKNYERKCFNASEYNVMVKSVKEERNNINALIEKACAMPGKASSLMFCFNG